jgi:hypothetical protein
MITHELAKKLLDAGLPLDQWRHRTTILPLHEEDVAEELGLKPLPAIYLDELIKACGPEFASLYRTGDGRWRATLRGTAKCFEASSPEEAVAELWLALPRPTS